MLGGADPVGVDRLDVARVGLAAPADQEALGDRARACRSRAAGTGGRPAPRADWATNDSAITDARARSSRACSSVMSMSGRKPHSGAEHRERGLDVDPRVARADGERVRLGRREARQQRAVDEQAPDLLERHGADEVLDVDAAVAQRAALAVGLGDRRGERDDALEAGTDLGRRVVVDSGHPDTSRSRSSVRRRSRSARRASSSPSSGRRTNTASSGARASTANALVHDVAVDDRAERRRRERAADGEDRVLQAHGRARRGRGPRSRPPR